MTDKVANTTHSHIMPSEWVLNFCPKCGTALQDRIAFSRTRRYCPNCDEIIFREHKVAAGLLVVDDGGRVLLVRRAWGPMQGYWSLPAGFVDFDEAPAEAAVRECHEETGRETEVIALLDLISGREHTRGADLVVIYRGRIIGGALAANDDAGDVGFFALDGLPPLAFRATRRAVERWRALCEEQPV